jgi:actin-like ATPase involved in cell morphogenesis
MALDKKKYETEYLRKLSTARGLAGDLIERYCIDVTSPDAEIADQVRAVRTYWASVRPGTRFFDVVNLCRSDDERLRAAYGEQMLRAAWWEELARSANTSPRDEFEGLLADGRLGAARWAAHHLTPATGRFAAITRVDEERERLQAVADTLRSRLDADDQVRQAILSGEAALETERRLLDVAATTRRLPDAPRAPRSTVVGIDLGTTYTAVAYIDDGGSPVVARNCLGLETTPSVIYFENESNVVVGETAKETAKVMPDNVVSLVKRQMGNVDFVREFFGREYSAPALSALILKKIAQSAETESGHKLEQAVITVPAYFGMLEKSATRHAGELAGIEVIDILPEPIAAAFGYGFDITDHETLLIYDLGGATFDVAVVRFDGDEVRMLVLDGDNSLGGTDWDEVLVDYIVGEVCSQRGDDAIKDDDGAMQEIWNQAERAKQRLSQAQSRKVIVRHVGGAATVEVSRAQFEELTRHLVEKTIGITKRCLMTLEEAHPAAAQQIREVLLVGGATKMPAIAIALRQEFGWDSRMCEPELVVAKGGALYGARLSNASIAPRVRSPVWPDDHEPTPLLVTSNVV